MDQALPSKRTHLNNDIEQTLPPANLFRRLMAMIYDAFLLFGITIAYGTIIVVLRLLAGEDGMQITNSVNQIAITSGMLFCYALFYAWCWHKIGQTLGMKCWRLQLQGLDKQLPSWNTCWLRCVLAPISMAIFGIGYLWCMIDKQGRCLHDIYSNTQVVLLPKKSRKKKAKKNKPENDNEA